MPLIVGNEPCDSGQGTAVVCRGDGEDEGVADASSGERGKSSIAERQRGRKCKRKVAGKQTRAQLLHDSGPRGRDSDVPDDSFPLNSAPSSASTPPAPASVSVRLNRTARTNHPPCSSSRWLLLRCPPPPPLPPAEACGRGGVDEADCNASSASTRNRAGSAAASWPHKALQRRVRSSFSWWGSMPEPGPLS